MNKIENRPFANMRVELDGNSYSHCTFTGCIFVFRGAAGFNLSDNTIENCSFEFSDAAAKTVLAMQAIYVMGDYGRNAIINTFNTIAPDREKLN